MSATEIIPRLTHNRTQNTQRIHFYFLWRYSPIRNQAASLLGFLDHTHTHTQRVGLLWTSDQPVAEVASYTTHNKHKGRTSISSAGIEPAIPAIKRLQTYALDSTATFKLFFPCGAAAQRGPWPPQSWGLYEIWNFNSGNYLFTTDIK